jgi:hypothetical protein
MTSPIDILTADEDEPGSNPTGGIEDITPEQLVLLAKKPASMLWTIRYVNASSSRCWAKKWVRKFRVWLAIGIGFGIAVNATGWAVLTLRMERVVKEVLKEEAAKKTALIEAGPNPAFAAIPATVKEVSP